MTQTKLIRITVLFKKFQAPAVFLSIYPYWAAEIFSSALPSEPNLDYFVRSPSGVICRPCMNRFKHECGTYMIKILHRHVAAMVCWLGSVKFIWDISGSTSC